jgi:hypothetical protein
MTGTSPSPPSWPFAWRFLRSTTHSALGPTPNSSSLCPRRSVERGSDLRPACGSSVGCLPWSAANTVCPSAGWHESSLLLEAAVRSELACWTPGARGGGRGFLAGCFCRELRAGDVPAGRGGDELEVLPADGLAAGCAGHVRVDRVAVVFGPQRRFTDGPLVTQSRSACITGTSSRPAAVRW